VAVKALAANVKKLRKAREWSQYDLAAEAGIEQNAVSLIENERANPTLLVVEEIARALAFDCLSCWRQPRAHADPGLSSSANNLAELGHLCGLKWREVDWLQVILRRLPRTPVFTRRFRLAYRRLGIPL
jgi:transcriptional regulator with XRE-family HTH domain